MPSLTCIVCPIGCSLTVEEPSGKEGALAVSGNRCARGMAYAQEEVRAPKRVVTATCGIAPAPQDDAPGIPARRVPVKTSAPCPKEKIPQLLSDIYKARVSLPVTPGDKVISDWQGSGIDVVAVRSLGQP